MSQKSFAATADDAFFARHLADSDPDINRAIDAEVSRQDDGIELMASGNIVSRPPTTAGPIQIYHSAVPTSFRSLYTESQLKYKLF